MKKYLSEFIGTFFLVFCGTGAIIINETSNGAITHLGIALSFGLIVTIMIYSIGEVSGAHINPAVSFAFLMEKQLTLSEFLKYIVSQTIGAISASISLKFLFPQSSNLGATVPAGSEMQSFVLEIVLAAMLMFVVGRVATPKNNLAGIIIGSVIALEALFAGPITGASMNPARSFAPVFVSGHNLHSVWIYLTAPFIGTFLGMKLSNYLR
ncbi:MAG TPA: aquaporin [Cytophagaceae bacterium]|jgi:aquaporin NIP|nr:aquaporin [Cytophagaceae bacterium]